MKIIGTGVNGLGILVAVGIGIAGLWASEFTPDEAPAAQPGEAPSFAFGVLADCQYHPVPGDGVRKYSLSEGKLTDCVRHFNRLDLEFVIHLGDFIDRDSSSFAAVGPIYDRLSMVHYQVLGNHDFAVPDADKAHVPARLGLTNRYYDFSVKGWRFVVLDGNDISLHAHAVDSPEHDLAREYLSRLPKETPSWNGAIGTQQLAWLREVLVNAAQLQEHVLVFCHFPVHPENPHNLWNSAEVIELIEAFPGVMAYLNGHNHDGNYGLRNDVHYLTLKGMVDTEQTAYATIRVYPDRLEISGFGREQTRSLRLRSPLSAPGTSGRKQSTPN